MQITVLVDIEAIEKEDPAFEGLTDHIRMQMEFHVIDDLRQLGHQINLLPCGPDIHLTMQRLERQAPDLVFNLTEHYGGDRRKDMHIAALIELTGIPYTGSGPEGLLICRDKALCKTILRDRGIPVPDFRVVHYGDPVPRSLPFPIVVKPCHEDGSDGITRRSYVRNRDELERQIGRVHQTSGQAAICETFIPGFDVYAAMLGNRPPQVFPLRELRFDTHNPRAPQIATGRIKLNDAYRKKWGLKYRFARLSKAQVEHIERLSRRIYRKLHLRDYARLDLRMAPNGIVYFIEANPNPELTMGDDFAESARKAGIDHVELIRRIITLARRRGE